MTLLNLITMFNNHMNNPGVDNSTLTDWANEFIDYICFDCNSLPIKSIDYVVTDTSVLQDLPPDYWSMVNWYVGSKQYNKVKIREDGKLIFVSTGTFTLIYNAKPVHAVTSSANLELSVDSAYHGLFMDFLKGKFYGDDGEGDETTGYGGSLLNTAKVEASRISTNKQNTNPVVPKARVPIYRGAVDTDDE